MPSPWQGLLGGFDRSDPRGSIASLLANRPQGGGLFGGLSGLSGGLLGGGGANEIDYTSGDSTGGLSDLGNLGAAAPAPTVPTPPSSALGTGVAPVNYTPNYANAIMGDGPGPFGSNMGEVGGQPWQPPLGTNPNMNPGMPPAGQGWTVANTPMGMPVEGVPANTGDQPLRFPTMTPIPQVNMPMSDADFAAASAMGNSEGVTITPGVTPFNAPFGAGNSQGTPGIENLPSYLMQGGNWTPNNAAAQGTTFNSGMPDYTLQDYNTLLGPGVATNPSLYGSTPIPR